MLLLMMEDLLSSRSMAISSRARSRWLETRADIFLSNRFMVVLFNAYSCIYVVSKFLGNKQHCEWKLVVIWQRW
jgi:hypothetical protein